MYLAIPHPSVVALECILKQSSIARTWRYAKLQLTDFIECKDIGYINWRRGCPQGNGSLTSF